MRPTKAIIRALAAIAWWAHVHLARLGAGKPRRDVGWADGAEAIVRETRPRGLASGPWRHCRGVVTHGVREWRGIQAGGYITANQAARQLVIVVEPFDPIPGFGWESRRVDIQKGTRR